LRLRRVTAPDGSVVHKLGKKYPGAGLSSRPMTNIYLDAAEYGALVGGGFAIDVFEGALAGLMLAEISADDDVALAAIVMPSWCAMEVTEDVAYAGGTLAIDGWHATAAPGVVTIAEGDER
jgi:hypothetical protein